MQNAEYTTTKPVENEHESRAQADAPIRHLMCDLEALERGKPPRDLAEVPLQDVIGELSLYIIDDQPVAAVQLTEHVLARGAGITIGIRDEDVVDGAAVGGGARVYYLAADLIEFACWTPVSEGQPLHDPPAAEGTMAPANAALEAVLRIVQLHLTPLPEEEVDPQGPEAVFCAEANLPVPRVVSYHGSNAGAIRAVLRRIVQDIGWLYWVAPRAEVLASRDACMRLWPDGVGL